MKDLEAGKLLHTNCKAGKQGEIWIGISELWLYTLAWEVRRWKEWRSSRKSLVGNVERTSLKGRVASDGHWSSWLGSRRRFVFVFQARLEVEWWRRTSLICWSFSSVTEENLSFDAIVEQYLMFSFFFLLLLTAYLLKRFAAVLFDSTFCRFVVFFVTMRVRMNSNHTFRTRHDTRNHRAFGAGLQALRAFSPAPQA